MEDYKGLQPVTGMSKMKMVGGKGAELWDAEDNHYLDLNEISLVLGQGNERFTEKMCAKLHGLTSGKAGFSEDKQKLFRYLDEGTGGRFNYIHMTSSGSESSEWAVRMALKLTGRSEVLSFWNSIHGRTYLGASMSGMMRRKQGYGPSAPGVLYGIYPDCARCPFEKNCENCDFFCLKFLDQKMKYESSHEIGAVIVEAFQGAGVVIPPKGWLKALETWAHEHGALFILDEVQSGMGRSGQLFCFEEEGLDPDMLLLGKGLGNGFHVGAVLCKEVPDEFYRMALAGGAGDSELTCAAGCAVFEELLEHGMLEHIREVSAHLEEKLSELKDKHPEVIGLRCKGLAVNMEFGDTAHFERMAPMLRAKGLLLGAGGNKVTMRPPYALTKEQVDYIAQVMDEAIVAARE